MVPIDSLESLREELTSLQDQGYVQANGPLERRGIDVDHAFYTDRESVRLETSVSAPTESEERATARDPADQSPQSDRITTLEATVSELVAARTQLTDEIESLKQQLEQLSDDLHDLRSALGN